MHVYIYIYINKCMYIYMCICIYIYIYICIHICIQFIYLYIHIHIYIHIHTYTYVYENTYIDEYVHGCITVGVSTPLTKSQYVLFTLAAACTRTPNKTARIASILSHPSPDLNCACVHVCVCV